MMLSTAAGNATSLKEAGNDDRKSPSVASRKVWLPKLIYESLPFFYLASGLAAFFATLHVSDWFWVLPHTVLFSALCIHLGVIVYCRRRRKKQRSVDTIN